MKPSTLWSLKVVLALASGMLLIHATARAEVKEHGALVMDGMPNVDSALQERSAAYSNVRHASLVNWLPDGQSLLIRTRFGEVNQLHHVKSPLGARKQITFFDEPVAMAAVRPVRSQPQLAYLRDDQGAENYQLYLFNTEDGVHQRISDGKSRYTNPMWSKSGQFLLYSSNERNGVDFDIYRFDVDTAQSTRIYEVIGSYSVSAIAHNEKRAVVRQYISVSESRLVLLDLVSRRVEPINVLPGKTAYGDVVFHKDDQSIFVVHSGDSDFRVLSRYALDSRRITHKLVRKSWDVESIVTDPSATKLAYTVNEDGQDKLYVLNLQDDKEISLATLPMGVIGALAFNSDGDKLAISHASPQSPSDVFVTSLLEPKWVRWTESETGGLNRKSFVTPALVRYPTFDKVSNAPRTIPAIVYKPAMKAEGQKFPVVISIHGGPEGQARPVFDDAAQFLTTQMNIAYILPNVRGSSGYGEQYLALDNGYLREDSVKDIGALLDWIRTQPDLDADRVLVTGGSYGGYMVLASLVHFGDRLKGGIDVVGISHFSTFLKNTKGYRQELRRVEYGDERDPEMRKFHGLIAPLNNAEKIVAPLFVVQGLNDPRVPVTEAEQIVKRVRANNMPVWYLLAKDEGHGFSKKSNRDMYRTYSYQFIAQQLLGTPQ